MRNQEMCCLTLKEGVPEKVKQPDAASRCVGHRELAPKTLTLVVSYLDTRIGWDLCSAILLTNTCTNFQEKRLYNRFLHGYHWSTILRYVCT